MKNWSGKIFAVVAAVLMMGMLGESAWAQAKKTPRPALVVLSKDENYLAIVDPRTLAVVATVPTGPVPHEVAVSADGKYAVATNYGAHADGTTLSVIDLDAQKEIHRVELGELKGPHGVVFAGNAAWFTAEGAKAAALYSPEKNKIERVVHTEQERTHMVALVGRGLGLVTTNVNSDTVSYLPLKTPGEPKASNLAVGKGPEGMDVSPDGRELWVANSGDGSVSIVGLPAWRVLSTIRVETKHSNRLKFTPDGKRVFISDLGSGELVIVDVAGRKVEKRLKLGKSCEGILMEPGGKRAFVAVSGDDKVAVVDLQTLEVTKTFAIGKDPDGMAWTR